LQILKDQILAAGGSADIYKFDPSYGTERNKLYNSLVSASLHLDFLINNAGLAWYGFFHKMPWSNAREIIRVNIEAVAHITSLFLPHMVEQYFGYIINIGSIACKSPEQGVDIYSASKAFLDANTTSQHRKLKRTPGFILQLYALDL